MPLFVSGQVTVKGLRRVAVDREEDALRVLFDGDTNRQVGTFSPELELLLACLRERYVKGKLGTVLRHERHETRQYTRDETRAPSLSEVGTLF